MRDTSVDAEEFLVDKAGERQCVKKFHCKVVDVLAVLVEA